MTKNFHSQKGLTLIEVLISIVLLGIILTTFMGFFTQSSLFSKKNEQKLGTMQTAQMYINLVEDNVSKSRIQNLDFTKVNTLNKQQIDDLIKPAQPIVTPYTITAVIKTKTADNNIPDNLFQFKITVENPNTNSKSETYTYLMK